MDSGKKMLTPMKRTLSACYNRVRPAKKQAREVEDSEAPKTYKFRVLLPDGTCLGMRIDDPVDEELLDGFIDSLKNQHAARKSQKPKREINWSSRELRLVDGSDNVINRMTKFSDFKPDKCHILRLRDGSAEPESYEDMWDLTPDTEMLRELPADYTLETALADLIDNSLQAVWANNLNERRFISLEINKDRISIFDTGRGMDVSSENSIEKWGKMGSSLHRSARADAIGGKPPYLVPFFGMFGSGGPHAAMDLGRRARVSSKTKKSKNVYTLHLEREALLKNSEKTWMTKGSIRPSTDDEIKKSPQCSFTQVEIFEHKAKGLDVMDLQCKLKDIYFPYIQCDEVSNTGRTVTPIEFQVNGTDLAEIQGGEVAITNLHSSNGPHFVTEIQFSHNVQIMDCSGARVSQEANARMKFVYFPIVKGKESIDKILEELEENGCGITESFQTFSRVSIRRLGRLLPDARWRWLPLMDLTHKKGDKAQILKRCCMRVKCFIDADAGLNPTPSKTDLAHHHPYTLALKNFGNKSPENGDFNLKMLRDGKEVTLQQLEKQYHEWILHMHDCYDKEIDSGRDDAVHVVVSTENMKKLHINSDIARVHKEIERKGKLWKSGQKIKVLKGACPGVQKTNMYATIEYIIIGGFQGDTGGEARLICRPLGIPLEKGCIVEVGKTRINLRDSVSLPICIIDSGKAMTSSDWEIQVERQRHKIPSTIELLTESHCQELGFEGALPSDPVINAGHLPPNEIVAVFRPASFPSANASNKLDQKHIVVRENTEMCLELKFRSGNKEGKHVQHKYSGRITATSHKGFHGLYQFPLRSKFQNIFQEAGIYTFTFSLGGSGSGDTGCKILVKKIEVKPSSNVRKWEILSGGECPICVRVGSNFPPISLCCFDEYGNRTTFPSTQEVSVKIMSDQEILNTAQKISLNPSLEGSTLELKDILIESGMLYKIHSDYMASFVISSLDDKFSVELPCKVLPGSLKCISMQPTHLDKNLVPDHVIENLMLLMLDAYGNHVEPGLEFELNVEGFYIQDKNHVVKVNEDGFINLSGLLKVTASYGGKASFSLLLKRELVLNKEFDIVKRELRLVSKIPEDSLAGSHLDNLVFHIVCPDGNVDESFHDDEAYGRSHTLTIKSETFFVDDSVKYSFRYGCCTIRTILLPQNEGTLRLLAAHSRHPELNLTIEVPIMQPPSLEPAIVESLDMDEKIPLPQNSPAPKVLKLEYDHFQADTLLLKDFSQSENMEDLGIPIPDGWEPLEQGLREHGLCIAVAEKELRELNARKLALEEDISMLQASKEVKMFEPLINIPDKEAMIELIQSKEHTAASVLCRLLKEVPLEEQQQNDYINNIVGIVAILGEVQTSELSRILADYLGEDQMLAIVCKSHSGKNVLEKYNINGNVDCTRSFHRVAARLGQSIRGRFDVIILEDIVPYSGELGSYPVRKLQLPDPVLPSGEKAMGFVGYAVNLINPDVQHMHTRIIGGHGLRETLFYRLFGELQVYQTRDHMRMAKDCIKHGAVSLDGGIMKGNGVLSLGNCNPEIRFPATAAPLPVHSMEILEQIEEKKLKIAEICRETAGVEKRLKKSNKRYQKQNDKCQAFLKNIQLGAMLCDRRLS